MTTSSPNLYTKLGVHSRAEAVESARTLRTPTLSQAMPDNFEPNGPWFTALAPV